MFINVNINNTIILLLNCDNKVVSTIAMINWCITGMILSKYRIPSVNIKVHDIKSIL